MEVVLEFLLSVGPTGSSAAVISNLLNLPAALAGRGPRANAATFHRRFFFVFSHHTEEAISFVAQVAVIFRLLVQLDGGGGGDRRGTGGRGVLLWHYSNTSGQNKSLFFLSPWRPVTHLPVNDTSSSC